MRERQRRFAIPALAALAVAAALATTALAAVDGKLDGKFLAEVRAVEASFPVDDTPVERNYKFMCLNRKCSKVEFKREGGDGFAKSKLSEDKPGVFKGTERTEGDDCPDSDGSSVRLIAHEVKIAKAAKSGKAKKLTGTSHYSWPDCDGDPTQTTKFTAVRK